MPQRSHGLGLIELLIVLVLIGMALAFVLPALAAISSERAAGAAAREVATWLQAQRWLAVAQRRSHGLYFEQVQDRWVWYAVRDGNGNGLRTDEVRRGTDPRLSGPHRIGKGGTARLGFPGGPIPRIPPRRGAIQGREDPIQFGRSNIVSFGPLGSASSGTIYVTDGRRALFGIVLFGPSARIRVWRYSVESGQWTL